MNLYERISELLACFHERIQENPRYGSLICIAILSFWLFGVICGWKWTYATSTWNQNTLRKMLGEKGYRIGVGVLLAIALTAVLYLFFSMACRVDIQEDQIGQRQILETFTYCFEENKITATDVADIAECSEIHAYSIEPFFEDMITLAGFR